MRLVLVKVSGKNGETLFKAENKDDEKAIGDRAVLVCDLKGVKATITALQMRSIHLYFTLLSEAFNAAGLDMKMVMEKLSKNTLIPWSPSAIKERLFRPVIINTFGKESTTELETEEVSISYEALNQVTSEKFGVSVPFPDKYNQMCEYLNRN